MQYDHHQNTTEGALEVYFINIIKCYKVWVTKSLLFNEWKGDSPLHLPKRNACR